MDDRSVMVIISSEGCQQGDPVAQFVFSLAEGPVLMTICTHTSRLDNRCCLFAVHDDITAVVPLNLVDKVYFIVSQELKTISLVIVPRKSQLYTLLVNYTQVPSDLHLDIQVHFDGVELRGTA